ncbi:UvrD-helicase domain-containing protein [Metasolibacillus sp. FSL K6-0083]|uniref:UvrD-helicase domain-containing protein n=1 Tax=Metasolibacillus sp. FSL K6-0083 TaxID=2921416 RepID=UPI00315AADC3
MTGSLKIISAGAGAGKTTSLSKEIISAVIQQVAPEKIMATTFTKKAGEELIERIRLELLKSGKTDEASRILDGYVGTMNSVFGRLIKEFALEIGLSPEQNILEDSEALLLFNSIAYKTIEKYERQHYTALQRFQLIGGDYPWNKYVLDVLKLARENGLLAKDVEVCATFSWETMEKWLPSPTGDSEQLTSNLIVALKNASITLPGTDSTKTTQTVVESIRSMLSYYERNGYLTWDHWAKASKLKPAKASQEEVLPIHNAACIHTQHPLLHKDIKGIIQAVFNCAAEAIEQYEKEKSLRGLIDFTDQEYLALKMLETPEYIAALKERIEAVFVDEFQDSSPLQIALNMKLLEVAKKATWVGDTKQAIYGFRGTDPELMKIAMNSINDITKEILSDSYRSRKSLVEFVNALFIPVFEVTGLPKELVELNPKRLDLDKQQPSIEAWTFIDSKNVKTDAKSVAQGIYDVIQQKEEYIVIDKETRLERTLKPNDIAILCRSNDECSDIASALANIGIQATIGGSGLMDTEEVVYTIATLCYLINKRDTLALAKIIHFSSDFWQNGEWLEEWLKVENPDELVENDPIIKQLSEARENIYKMSPSETLDLAIVKAKVDEQVMRWGNAKQRLANIDNLRSLVKQYEHGAETNGYAATVNGLLFYLEDVKKDKELNRVAESTNENAVKILTYHRSKGLEWPFVILYSLNKSAIGSGKPPVFDRILATSTQPFDVEKPLNGRTLYYWPWPYGKSYKGVGFDAYVENTPQLDLRKKQLFEESQRLLYVGMTRARDYLVLATRDFSKASWLKEQKDANDNEIITSISSDFINVNGKSFNIKTRNLKLPEQPIEIVTASDQIMYVGITNNSVDFKSANFIPSMTTFIEIEDEDVLKAETLNVPVHSIGSRLPIIGSPEMDVLGTMVHTFLAADSGTLQQIKREQLAQSILQNYNITALKVNDLIESSNRLHRFIEQTYTDKLEISKEFPIHLRLNNQKAFGLIDYLIELPNGWVIIDHKTFPGREELWVDRAVSYLPQLQIYAHALEIASSKPVLEAWIHMPIVGRMVQFSQSDLVLTENSLHLSIK